jgi:hypothetical protein
VESTATAFAASIAARPPIPMITSQSFARYICRAAAISRSRGRGDTSSQVTCSSPACSRWWCSSMTQLAWTVSGSATWRTRRAPRRHAVFPASANAPQPQMISGRKNRKTLAVHVARPVALRKVSIGLHAHRPVDRLACHGIGHRERSGVTGRATQLRPHGLSACQTWRRIRECPHRPRPVGRGRCAACPAERPYRGSPRRYSRGCQRSGAPRGLGASDNASGTRAADRSQLVTISARTPEGADRVRSSDCTYSSHAARSWRRVRHSSDRVPIRASRAARRHVADGTPGTCRVTDAGPPEHRSEPILARRPRSAERPRSTRGRCRIASCGPVPTLLSIIRLSFCGQQGDWSCADRTGSRSGQPNCPIWGRP